MPSGLAQALGPVLRQIAEMTKRPRFFHVQNPATWVLGLDELLDLPVVFFDLSSPIWTIATLSRAIPSTSRQPSVCLHLDTDLVVKDVLNNRMAYVGVTVGAGCPDLHQ